MLDKERPMLDEKFWIKLELKLLIVFSHFWVVGSRFGFLGVAELLVDHELHTELRNEYDDQAHWYSIMTKTMS